uniref:Pentapeptide repeat-containing protein n=1 Tax=Candidatus Kentrum sp. UNK TaxID=2126344 RepID=A0A451A077_9GAMM|nr:MAG: Pentapeptide repeat-containing protein [Candidatus Kentron sp. UNK]VFK68734.1 MAG: Pentapeptide repeat-containing protein [Candidatus Kentron sp. UNK]
MAVAVALAGVLAGAGAVAVAVAVAVAGAGAGVGAVAGAGALAVAVFFLPAFYVAWRVRKEDPLFAGSRPFGWWLGSLGGTNFRGANLTRARFRGAVLKQTRFVGVKELKGVDFRDAKGLRLANVKGTPLEDPQARDLLVSGEGPGRSYAGLNLKGVFLAGARLAGADFTEADLSEADLTGAILREAILAKTQLIGTDLAGARFTGACIESWNIDRSTNLQDIDCDWVFMAAGGEFRQPDSGVFKQGEFSKLFQEVAETIDFIVDSRMELAALLAAVRKLREGGKAGLEVQGWWVQKGDAAVVHVAAPPEFDRERLHAELIKEKEMEFKLLETEYKARLLGKDERIADFKERELRLETLLSERANIYQQHIINSTVTGATLNQEKIQGSINTSARDIGAQPDAGRESEPP